MVQVEHHLAELLSGEPSEHPLDERTITEGHGRFGDEPCQRIEAAASAGCQH